MTRSSLSFSRKKETPIAEGTLLIKAFSVCDGSTGWSLPLTHLSDRKGPFLCRLHDASLYVACLDGTVKVYDLYSGTCSQIIRSLISSVIKHRHL